MKNPGRWSIGGDVQREVGNTGLEFGRVSVGWQTSLILLGLAAEALELMGLPRYTGEINQRRKEEGQG